MSPKAHGRYGADGTDGTNGTQTPLFICFMPDATENPTLIQIYGHLRKESSTTPESVSRDIHGGSETDTRSKPRRLRRRARDG